jgi:spermidine synthase
VLLTVAGRVLMNSRANRSEIALAQLTCANRAGGAAVLVGGLGLGCTLRAALDLLPADARVVLAEIDPAIVRWCRMHLADLNGRVLDDPRVELRVEDVAATVGRAGSGGRAGRFDAILFDLYEGPSARSTVADHPLYGPTMLRRVRGALRPGGVFAVWSEQPCGRFEARLRRAGYRVELTRPGRGGLRHAVYLAHPTTG